jgi:hypothetical protein
LGYIEHIAGQWSGSIGEISIIMDPAVQVLNDWIGVDGRENGYRDGSQMTNNPQWTTSASNLSSATGSAASNPSCLSSAEINRFITLEAVSGFTPESSSGDNASIHEVGSFLLP